MDQAVEPGLVAGGGGERVVLDGDKARLCQRSVQIHIGPVSEKARRIDAKAAVFPVFAFAGLEMQG